MVPLPDRIVALPDTVCPPCWDDFGIKGSVSAIVTADGLELYRRCVCGYGWSGGAPVQTSLFPPEATT